MFSKKDVYLFRKRCKCFDRKKYVVFPKGFSNVWEKREGDKKAAAYDHATAFKDIIIDLCDWKKIFSLF